MKCFELVEQDFRWLGVLSARLGSFGRVQETFCLWSCGSVQVTSRYCAGSDWVQVSLNNGSESKVLDTEFLQTVNSWV